MPKKPGTCPVRGTCPAGHVTETTAGGPRRTTWRGKCPAPGCEHNVICRAVLSPKTEPGDPPQPDTKVTSPAPPAPEPAPPAKPAAKPIRKVDKYREPAEPGFEPPRNDPDVPAPHDTGGGGSGPAGVPDPARGTGKPAGQPKPQPDQRPEPERRAAADRLRERARVLAERRRQRAAARAEEDTIPGIY